MFYGFAQNFHHADIEVQSLVAASKSISNPNVHSFSAPERSLFTRGFLERKALSRLQNQHKFDLVASHFALNTLPILDKISGVPLVFHFHGPWALESQAEQSRAGATWAKKQIELISYRSANRFIVLSKAFQNILHQEYGVALDRIHVVPGGVDIDHFSPTCSQLEARKKLDWKEERTILLSVRRLAKRMGLENLLVAISLIRQQHPDILLYIAGKGYLQAEIEALIQELNLSDHVKLLGFLPDSQLPIAYRAADFSVVPSISLEGFGLIIIESLACGTPTLATAVGGIPEILSPLSPDLLMTDSSPAQMSQSILEILSGKRRSPSSKDCTAYVEQKYSWPIITRQVKDVYEMALSND